MLPPEWLFRATDELIELWAQAIWDPARTELCHVNEWEQGNLTSCCCKNWCSYFLNAESRSKSIRSNFQCLSGSLSQDKSCLKALWQGVTAPIPGEFTKWSSSKQWGGVLESCTGLAHHCSIWKWFVHTPVVCAVRAKEQINGMELNPQEGKKAIPTPRQH